MNSPWRTMTGDERIGWFADHWRMAVPILITLLAIWLMSFPLFTPTTALPQFAMLSVLIWSLVQPQLMPAWLALPLGIITDASLGLPIGINATLMPILALGVSISEQRTGVQMFLAEWAVAAIIIFTYQLLTALLLGFVLGDVPGRLMLIQGLATSLAYPPAVRAISRLQRRWAMPR